MQPKEETIKRWRWLGAKQKMAETLAEMDRRKAEADRKKHWETVISGCDEAQGMLCVDCDGAWSVIEDIKELAQSEICKSQ